MLLDHCYAFSLLLWFRSPVLDCAQVSNIKNFAVSLGYYDSLFDYIAIYEMCML